MSNFFKTVYSVVQSIPCGMVMNYGTVALIAGSPRSARQVGYALHVNPDPNTIPCHRVVMKDGSLSEAFAFGGAAEHRFRLEAEGVTFKGDKVDMDKHLACISIK